VPQVHRIRLRGGWVTSARPDGVTRHARRFGSPRALDPTETVVLTADGLAGAASVILNGTALGQSEGGFAFDITALLLPRNEVWIDSADPPGEVALEFRAGT
jgi:hypothetical protein